MRFLCSLLLTLGTVCDGTSAAEPLEIGSRRELFLDSLMVDCLEGDARRVFHKPVPREVVIQFDQPWEGNTSSGCTVFRDGDRYRMYYRATQGEDLAGYWCYAESRDGIQWTRPSLGLVEYGGSKENNILSRTLPDTGNPVVFRDDNPAASADARYKGVSLHYLRHAGDERTEGEINDWWATVKEKSLTLWKSPDGIHWTMIQEEGIFKNEGYFDSQNLAFWDPNVNAYRAYFREICPDSNHLGGIRRAIKTGTSPDFIHWTRGAMLSDTQLHAERQHRTVRRYRGARGDVAEQPRSERPRRQAGAFAVRDARRGFVFDQV